MFKVNDYVVYGSQGVCQIIAIEKDKTSDKAYYVLKPIQGSLIIKTSVNNSKVSMRRMITNQEVKSLIHAMPEVEPLWIKDTKQRCSNYRALVRSGNLKDLIQVIKTFYLKYVDHPKDRKKMTVAEKQILETAKKRLYEEFAFVLNIPKEQVEDYILQHVN